MAPMNTFLVEHDHVLRNYFSILIMVGDCSTYYRAVCEAKQPFTLLTLLYLEFTQAHTAPPNRENGYHFSKRIV